MSIGVVPCSTQIESTGEGRTAPLLSFSDVGRAEVAGHLVAYLSATGRRGWAGALGGGVAPAIADGEAGGLAAERRRRWTEDAARRRVVEERLRIARENARRPAPHAGHDQPAGGDRPPRLAAANPKRAEAALRCVRTASADALTQARSTLAAIRDPAPASARPGRLRGSVRVGPIDVVRHAGPGSKATVRVARSSAGVVVAGVDAGSGRVPAPPAEP